CGGSRRQCGRNCHEIQKCAPTARMAILRHRNRTPLPMRKNASVQGSLMGITTGLACKKAYPFCEKRMVPAGDPQAYRRESIKGGANNKTAALQGGRPVS